MMTTQDIVKQVAKELELPETKVLAVYDTIISYLRELIKSPLVTAIRLPFLGVLLVKERFLKTKDEKLDNTKKFSPKFYEKVYKKYHESIKSKRSLIREHTKKHNGDPAYADNKHFKKNKIDLKFFNSGLSIREIEAKQNGEN